MRNIETTQGGEQQSLQTEKYASEAALQSISQAVGTAELPNIEDLIFCVRPTTELWQSSVTRLYGRTSREAREMPLRSRVEIRRLNGTVGIYYGSRSFISLEDKSHRFLLGTADEKISYHREPFNVDCQTIPSRVLDLHGIEEIADSPDAREELLWLAQRLEGLAPEHLQAGRLAAKAAVGEPWGNREGRAVSA